MGWKVLHLKPRFAPSQGWFAASNIECITLVCRRADKLPEVRSKTPSRGVKARNSGPPPSGA